MMWCIHVRIVLALSFFRVLVMPFSAIVRYAITNAKSSCASQIPMFAIALSWTVIYNKCTQFVGY